MLNAESKLTLRSSSIRAAQTVRGCAEARDGLMRP
jgi:hypothetical protein